jgi:hypothetical protein
MTYRIPGTRVALPIVVSTWAKKPFYVRLSGAEEGSLLPLLLCGWLSLARSSHLIPSEVFTLKSLRKKRKKRMNSPKFAGTEF